MTETFVSKYDSNEIEQFFDFAGENIDYFREGRNLSSEEKALIKPGEIWGVSYVNKIPSHWKTLIGDCFIMPNLGLYNNPQRNVWLKKAKELFTEREHREPTNLELIAEAWQYEIFTRYKLCYVLFEPIKVGFNLSKYCQQNLRENVDLFLAFATKIDPPCETRPYPYFDIICKNSFLEDHNSTDISKAEAKA